MKISKLKEALLSQPDISKTDQLKIGYALELLRNEGIKTILYFIFFAVIGNLPEFLLCMGMSCTVRAFAGGIHMKTNVSCFLMSFVMLSSEIILLPKLPVPQICYTVALWICVVLICFLSPVPSYKRPFKTRERYALCKKYSYIFTIAWGIILSLLMGFPYIQHCGIWYLVLQTIQMIIQTLYRNSLKEN